MVDLPGPTPVRGVTAPDQPQTPLAGRATRPVSSAMAARSLPQLVSLAAELSNAPPPVDYAKIAQIRVAISTGSYRIEPDGIARALLGK